MKKTLTIALLMGFLSPISALAHPGKTDKYGCHVCRSDCEMWNLKVGQYHCHKNQPQIITASAKQVVKTEPKTEVKTEIKEDPKVGQKAEEKETPPEHLNFLEKCLKWLKQL